MVQLRMNEGGAADHVTWNEAIVEGHVGGNLAPTYNSDVEPSCSVITHVKTAPLEQIVPLDFSSALLGESTKTPQLYCSVAAAAPIATTPFGGAFHVTLEPDGPTHIGP